jgi:predicted ATPase/DNA-binding CsgD family transcriptional regulator
MVNTKSGHRLGNLHIEFSEFVGRRAEIASAKRALGQSRLVTLTGPGGIGKTRLATQVAAEVRRAFVDGAWLVELAGLRDPALLAREVARSLGLSDRSTQWAVTTLSDQLASKRVLLLLDTCEHLLDASAVLAETVLHSCPGVRVLTTSREPLGVVGEAVLQVPTMSLPPEGESAAPERLLRSEAARLFLSRATAANPQFSLTQQNAAVIADVVRRLEGIPLAIELAAIRMRSLSPEQLLDRLHDRFDVLTTGSRTAEARQQTLQSTLEWSYELLTVEERAIWRRAAVFIGSFDIVAAEAICSDGDLTAGDVFGLIDSLVAKSVIMREPGEGQARYRMLDTVREFGWAKHCEDEPERWLAARHRDWYAGIAALPDALSARQVDWVDGLHRNHSNLRAALDFCHGTQGEDEAGLRMVCDLWLYWESRGHLTEGRRWAELFLHSCADCPARARGLWVAGYLALVQGDIKNAGGLLDEAVNLGRIRDEPTIAFAIEFLGRARWIQGDTVGGVQLTEDALRLHRDARDWRGIVLTLVQLGLMKRLEDESVDSRPIFEECIRICEEHDERWNRSYALWAYGLATWRENRFGEAARLEEQALQLKRDVRDPIGIPLCVEALAWIASGAGEHERAALLLGSAAGRWRALPGDLPAPLATYRKTCHEELSRALGDGRFKELFELGRDASADEVMDLALNRTSPAVGIAPMVATGRTSELSPRETEVVALLARGLSNSEIGQHLVISSRTAESHIQHIMNKLGLSSRAQIAAWAATLEADPD